MFSSLCNCGHEKPGSHVPQNMFTFNMEDILYVNPNYQALSMQPNYKMLILTILLEIAPIKMFKSIPGSAFLFTLLKASSPC